MPLSAGDRLGPYEILGSIGQGGMGAVYRATDTKLGRDVAIKVLPDAFANDPDRLARFTREAQVLAALNHPNIAAIYGLEDGALVLELVEGPTLADRISQGPIPLDEALAFARQIGEALEAAHERGIIHRDLKPANIKITPDGRVKVLDFGLAKALGGDVAQSDPANSPTRTMESTRVGVILGTASYMAPEQATGKRADRRADIWAFGVVLYEMLTGKRLFSGESVPETLVAVLSNEPNLNKVPSEVRRLLQSCLEKEPKQRVRDIGDVWLLLEESAKPRTATVSRTIWPWVAATAVFAAAALVGWLRPNRAPQTSVTLSIAMPPGERVWYSAPVISPDGMSVWYETEDLRQHVRRIDSLGTRLFAEPAREPAFWSPDSASFFFWGTRQLFEVRPALDAMERVLTGRQSRGTLSDRGTFLFSDSGHCLAAVYTPGGEPKAVQMPSKFDYCFAPEFLPGGQDFIFSILHLKNFSSQGLEIYLSSLRDGKASEPVLLLKNPTMAHYTPAGGGRLLYVRGDNLYSQKLDLRVRRLEGEPDLIAQSVASMPAGLGTGYFSVARNGTVAWRPGKSDLSEIVEFDRNGKRIGTSGPPGKYSLIVLSPDGKRLLTDGGDDAYIIDVGQPGKLDLPTEPDWIGWSGDGSKVIGAARESIVEASAAGAGVLRKFGKNGMRFNGVPDISADGKQIVGATDGGTVSILLDANPNEIAPKIVMNSSDQVRHPSLSPDRHWIVYSTAGGVYVRPFPGPGQRRLIGPNGQNFPFSYWRKDGNEILYFRDGDLMSVAVTWHREPSFGEPHTLFSGLRRGSGSLVSARPLTASPDGARIFWLQGPDQPNVIHVKTYAIR
jgi:eukaryotic-like serine/threonine-protein kinase